MIKDGILTIDIPVAIATDVIMTLNKAGYVLFARLEKNVMVIGNSDASAHAMMRRAESLCDTIRKDMDQYEANRFIIEMTELYAESCERFGPEVWVSQEIGGLLADTENLFKTQSASHD